MTPPEQIASYECPDCEGSGGEYTDPCERCDGNGVTHVACAKCGAIVPSWQVVFVAFDGKSYCQSHGDERLSEIAVSRGETRY
jgi:predicted RNA-binding Zn-ribbon protein involved in translation (DUF1610 family)